MTADAAASILVLEDEWVVAEMVRQTLADAGYAVVGPVNSVARALKAIEDRRIDAAVLDIWLGASVSFPLAEELSVRNIPFLFMTGYSATDLPEKFRGDVLLGKPLAPHALLAALRGLLG